MLRKLIISAIILCTSMAYAQSTTGWQTVTMDLTTGNLYTNNTPVASITIPTKITTGYISTTNSICEADFKDSATQVFTAAGYTRITNFAVNACSPIFTATDSNATLSVSGRYWAYLNTSLETASAADIKCHMYTNGAAAVTTSGNIVGFDVSTTQTAKGETVGFGKHIYITAGTVVDWRIQCGGTETITWNHGTVGLELK